MFTVKAEIQFLTPYCQSRFHDTPKLKKELPDDYERRTWRERLHTIEVDGVKQAIIPGIAFANCIKDAASLLSVKVPGKGNTTWAKHFEAGVLVFEDVQTGVAVDQVIEKRMHVPSDGVKGSGKRVMKSYPVIPPELLNVAVEFMILNDMITEDVFSYHLEQAGTLIGLGSFRIRRGGMFGMFKPTAIHWPK